MRYLIAELAPSQVDRLRPALTALHRHEVAVQPQLGSSQARSDDDYWDLYESRFADWFDEGNGFCLAAIDGADAVVGFVFCTEREGLAAYETGERIGYVEEIAVLDHARRGGVGEALMEAARCEFRERGYKCFQLSTVPGNDDARAFYSQLGMTPAANLLIGDV